MANRHDIAHRFANRQAGKNGRISAGNVRYEGRNYYSYNTVFGQWADVEKNVCIVFEGSTSPSSNRHKLGKWCFSDDVHVFPYNDNRGGWYSYNGCDLMGWEREFTFKHRCILIDYYVTNIYNSLASIKDGKKKGLENVDFSAWGYIEELCGLYKDTSIAKYLKWTKQRTLDDNISRKRKLVELLKAGERNVEVLTDALFGEGTYKTYWDYCARYRKAADKRAKVEALCNRLGIRSPYEKWGGYDVLDHEMSADDIRNLTAKERLDLHFASIARKEYNAHESERKEKYARNFRNAYKWIVGYEPKVESQWSGRLSKDVKKVRNMWTGDEYVVAEATYRSHIRLWGLKLDVHFDYDEFRKSEDKEEWIRNFYAECIEVDRNLRAISIFDRFGESVYTDQLVGYSTYRIYVINDVLREGTTDDELKICEDFVNRWNAILHDKQARRRAEEIARLKREEEERKEREYMEKVKQEQIDELSEQGIEGVREIWRRHYMSIEEAKRETYGMDGDFYFGGNVLLRLNLNKDTVETSKSIRIPVDTCKKMWKIVSKWHENPSCFKSMEIDTKYSGRYTISSYKNDILTAGCHKIAYTEMERMYNEIINA